MVVIERKMVSLPDVNNIPSARVAERIGMLMIKTLINGAKRYVFTLCRYNGEQIIPLDGLNRNLNIIRELLD
jgi:hypothetical protein